jgi:hypothetical protein
VAQISEFSLILAALGLSLGHLTEQTVGLIALVGLVTISVSTYMILYSQPLYERIKGYLSLFERRNPHRELIAGGETLDAPDMIVLGLGRYGQRIAERLSDQGHKVLAVDLDPRKLDTANPAYTIIYGDAADGEFLSTLPLAQARWLVCTIRDPEQLRIIVGALKDIGHGCRLALAAANDRVAADLSQRGVDLVLTPYRDAADSALAQLGAVLAAPAQHPAGSTP